MTTEEVKNNSAQITAETHMRTTELEDILGIKSSTYYKDIKYLNIQLFKDEDNCGWILKSELERLKKLREYVRINGRRNGFEENTGSELTIKKDNNLSKSNNKKNQIQSKQEIYVEPEDPRDNMDINFLIRQAAELKAREIAMKDLVVRAMADDLQEEELPKDLQEHIENARIAADPKFTPQDIANSILTNYRKN